jgi:Tfp pilus assembly protein PilV
MKIFKNLKNNKGFTIVETLVAVAILMIAITGPLTIAQKSLVAAIYAKDQVVASFLAQDAMEYLKNTRDTAKLSAGSSFADWLGVYDDCTPLAKCKIDTISGVKDLCSYSSNTCKLYKSASSYTTTSGGGSEETIYSRSFYLDSSNISDENDSDEVKVVVEVIWKNGVNSNKFTIENQFFNIIR